MNQSPFTPGAGHIPPILAGRDGLLRDWQLLFNHGGLTTPASLTAIGEGIALVGGGLVVIDSCLQ